MDRPLVPVLVSAIEHLSVDHLRWGQSWWYGLAGGCQWREEVTWCHGRQCAEHGAKLVWRSLLNQRV